jgi:site-specific recombinase XerD
VAASTKTTVARLKAAAQSEATTRSYAQAVRHFVEYGGRIPATEGMVARYLAEFSGKLATSTLQHRLIAIHRAHLDRGHKSPVMSAEVKRTMQGIRRSYGTAQRCVRALVKDDLMEVLAFVDKQKPMKTARDRALLLIGFAGAFRRSELVGIRIEDLTHYTHGLEVLLRRSKTDQEGHGRTVFIPHAKGDRCPVKSLEQWLGMYGVTEGPLFPAINRHDQVVRRSISPQSVALIVKQAVGRAKGLEAARHFSGHSMRAGYVTTAADVGLQPYQIREVTGHRSDVTLAKYIRPVQKRKIPGLL